ncbi:hypothetical protein AVEN_160387-1 [Araneus ventricosus]|uniref:Granulins domain-containing protein n=1 Tax=Araneus ventricosus TaxID=182803 RepID=A0A4Y2L933_ARAVE|nr:hypothetical protein AVEN_160387-1 [Araneus ventricosus]
MRGLIFMLLIPSLMAANVLCPNGKTTCPEELYCCEIDGEHRCCDDYATTDVPDTKMKVYPGIETTVSQASTLAFSNASMSADVALSYVTCSSIFNCEGPCCSTYNCCPHKFGSCCTSSKCCGSLSSCCAGGCCEFMSTCCGSRCCPSGSKCCSGTGGSWCCDTKYSCGTRYMTCRNKGIAFSPEITTVVVLALGFLMSRYL